MSKIVNEYGIVDTKVMDLVEPQIEKLTLELRKISKELNLTAEEIYQLYNYADSRLDCACTFDVARWGIAARKSHDHQES